MEEHPVMARHGLHLLFWTCVALCMCICLYDLFSSASLCVPFLRLSEEVADSSVLKETLRRVTEEVA